MTSSSVTYEKRDRIGIACFVSPDGMNALSETRFADIEEILDLVERDPDIGALIITGVGKAFCVGLDLDLLDKAFADLDYFEKTVRRVNHIVLRLEALPFPTIAAINGYARAGGFEIALGCDFMIVADDAKIGDAHTDSGVLPACVTLRLKRRVGEQRAKELLWTARWLQGPEAVTFGLALRSVPLAELVPESKRFAASLCDKPAPALAALKAVFRDGAMLSVAEGAQLELATFVRYMSTEPYGREGYRAYRERRSPSWRAV